MLLVAIKEAPNVRHFDQSTVLSKLSLAIHFGYVLLQLLKTAIGVHDTNKRQVDSKA